MKNLKHVLGLTVFLTSFFVQSQGFENFITVDGNQLLDGDKTFRFLSYNVPTLNYVEDHMDFEETNPYGLPSEFELRDVFETLQIVGGNVARTYTIPVRNKNFPETSVTYVEGPGEFNEDAFKVMDTMLALASEYKIRVIIPLVNNWEWMGGRPNYADFRDKDKDEFWTDKKLIKDFKKTIKYVLNRTNTVTGIKYKNDKTIMAWESGNELQNPPEWAIDIARYVKSIDKNHLFMDGFFAIHDGNNHSTFIQQYSIDEPAIDIISTHHYEPSSRKMLEDLKKTVAMVDGKKPLMVGEFGFIGISGIQEVLDYIVDENAFCGGLIWSLRRHDPDGGFYHHTEPFATVLYRAYHWPGFDDGEVYGERETLKLYREKSFEIQNLDVPEITVPKPPKLLGFSETPKFSWQGSAGASGYDIERSTSADGPWEIIEHNLDDVDTPGFDLYSDESALIGKTYYYRLRALNQAGKSEPSNIAGPIKIDFLTRVDYAKNLMVLERYKDLELKTGDCRSFKEAFSRIHGDKKAEGVYVVPKAFKEIRIFSYEGSKKPNMSFYSSENGIDYGEVKFDVSEYKSNEDNYDYLVPRKYVISASKTDFKAIKYIKFKSSDTIDIVRVELEYQ
ncbi:cellulase family glycosylhydrolase [Algibacter sp. 2305UL17-15]|uniref:cellulase family glycosylhydrolase n=1 Tax=Algibacter sp. 2305UL17-15 TaxID=3231268 RepID=UPI00345AEC8D